MNINDIVDWILQHPIQYPGKHNYSQERPNKMYQQLLVKDQFLLILSALREQIHDTYLQTRSIHMHHFGTFTFRILQSTQEPLLIQNEKYQHLPKHYHSIIPCFIADPYLQRQLVRYTQLDELEKSRGLNSIYQQSYNSLFCNGQSLANHCFIDRNTIDQALNAFTEAISDLIKLRKQLIIDFKFVRLIFKGQLLEYEFHKEFINTLNSNEFQEKIMKKDTNKPIQINKKLNEIYFAPWSPQALVISDKTKQLITARDMNTIIKKQQ